MSGINALPLDTEVSSIDTSYPRATPGTYAMLIDSAEIKPNKAGTGENLVLKLKSTTPITQTNGKDSFVPGAFKLTHYISLEVTEKLTAESISRSVAHLAKAARVSGSLRQVLAQPSPLQGKIVDTKVRIKQETSEYPEGNEVAQFIIPA